MFIIMLFFDSYYRHWKHVFHFCFLNFCRDMLCLRKCLSLHTNGTYLSDAKQLRHVCDWEFSWLKTPP